jgi:hypothetical protein
MGAQISQNTGARVSSPETGQQASPEAKAKAQLHAAVTEAQITSETGAYANALESEGQVTEPETGAKANALVT